VDLQAPTLVSVLSHQRRSLHEATCTLVRELLQGIFSRYGPSNNLMDWKLSTLVTGHYQSPTDEYRHMAVHGV
jgi:hypothetical protein